MHKRRSGSKRLLWDRRDRTLTRRQRAQKAAFLYALSLARQRKVTLEKALSDQGLDSRQALARTNYVKRRKGKLVPRVHDRIPRSLKFYEKGKLRHAEVANSKAASDIGRYWNAVAKLTETGKSTALRRLRRQRFRAMDGTVHVLERDPRIVLGLEKRRPVPELFEIYKR